MGCYNSYDKAHASQHVENLKGKGLKRKSFMFCLKFSEIQIILQKLGK